MPKTALLAKNARLRRLSMRLFLPLLALLLAAPSAPAQTPAAVLPRPDDFISRNEYLLDGGRATGDLNGDGLPDVAQAIGPANEIGAAADDGTTPVLPPRRLQVLLQVPGGGYRLAAQSKQAIMGRHDGGVFGDPFAGLAIKKGILLLNHYGGSNWRWAITDKFRWQQGDCYRIGHTNAGSWTMGQPCPGPGPGKRNAGDSLLDENLLTGDYRELEVSAECRVLVNRQGRRARRPLQRLGAFRQAEDGP